MENFKIGNNSSQPKLEKTGVNEAGYPSYKVNREDVEMEEYVKDKEGGWLSEEQRKSLKGYLMAIGVAATSANFIDRDNSPKADESNLDNKNAPTFVFEDSSNTVEASAQDIIQTEVDERFVLPDEQIKGKHTLDRFAAEVEKFAGDIDEVDLAETLEFANKPVVNHEGYTRAEYAKAAVTFRSEDDTRRNRPAVPELLQDELKSVLPGWLAQESRFKGDAVSSSNAAGIAQVLPSTWNEYRGTKKVSLSMTEQLGVFGELVSDNYHYLKHYAGDETLDKLRNKFDSEESFVKDLIAPLMVNAYNAGGPLIGKSLKSFVENVPESEMDSGKELFVQFADYAEISSDNYRQEQKDYAKKVYAFQSVFDDLDDNEETRVKFASR